MSKVEHYHSGSWVDISNYVTSGVDKVPRSMMNEDYTLKSDAFSIEVACTIRDDASYSDPTFKFEAGDLLRFTCGSTFIISGYVDKSKYDNSNMVFNVQINLAIFKLSESMADHDTLDAQVSSGSNWYEYQTYLTDRNVGVLWLMQCLLIVHGYTLDVSSVSSTVLWHAPNVSGSFDVDITYQDLFVDMGMVYAINQYVATVWGEIETAANRLTTNKIKCFDLLSDLLSATGLILKQTSATAFKLVEGDSYTVADSVKWAYESEELKGANVIHVMGVPNVINYYTTALYPDKAEYYSNTLTNINTQNTSGTGSVTVGFKMNFCIMFSDAKKYSNHFQNTSACGVCFALATLDKIVTDPTHVVLTHLNTAYRKMIAAVTDYTKDDITTDFVTADKGVLNHYVDLEYGVSQITQEAY